MQILFEAAAEVGFHCVKGTVRGSGSPIVLTIGFFGWGLLAGGLSLLVFRHSFVTGHWLRLLNLLLAPLAAGAAMAVLGRVRQSRGHDLVRLDQFSYAFTFAFAMSLVRYFFAG